MTCNNVARRVGLMGPYHVGKERKKCLFEPHFRLLPDDSIMDAEPPFDDAVLTTRPQYLRHVNAADHWQVLRFVVKSQYHKTMIRFFRRMAWERLRKEEEWLCVVRAKLCRKLDKSEK